MAAVGRLLKRDPSLTPLFVAVGAGVTGALAFGAHYLRHSPDVIVKKKQRPEPWNDVQQGQNTKLWSHSQNKDWWASRKDLPNPRAFMHSPVEGSESSSPSAAVHDAKEAAIVRAKQKTLAGFEKDKSGDVKDSSVMH
ncbi:hypothetical protein JCM8547_008163 [Rhodosporidiobolus lusitaniae]